MKFSLDIKRSEQLANICGSLDKNLENIANNLNVTISNKGADFNIKGKMLQRQFLYFRTYFRFQKKRPLI